MVALTNTIYLVTASILGAVLLSELVDHELIAALLVVGCGIAVAARARE